jgi:hypothetical protein
VKDQALAHTVVRSLFPHLSKHFDNVRDEVDVSALAVLWGTQAVLGRASRQVEPEGEARELAVALEPRLNRR